MPEFDDAVKLLSSPSTWCAGAARLAKLGDPEAIVPLTGALRSGYESSHLCVVEAIEALGGVRRAAQFAASPQPDHRQAALDLVLYLGDDGQLAVVESLAADPLPLVRARALNVLHQLKRTAAWRQTMFRLLAADDLTVRGAVVDSLALDVRGEISTKLHARLAVEPDVSIKGKIEAALATAK